MSDAPLAAVVQLSELESMLSGQERLTAEEEARGGRFVRDQDRVRYGMMHRLVLAVAAAWRGIDAGALRYRQRCADCGAVDHGSPWVEGAGRGTYSGECKPRGGRGRRRGGGGCLDRC